MSKPALDKSGCHHRVALLDKLDAPELRIWYEESGPQSPSYAVRSLAPAAPSAQAPSLVLHGTIRPCLAYLRTFHLARLSCS
ncbi:MAG: hypothetical protein ABSG43_21080, partial [Solirubrobacteraceae bacterium]